MATIVRFREPSDDIARANRFYGGLFGSKMEKMPGPMEYWMFRTTDNSGKETLGGGAVRKRQMNEPITNYMGVDSVDKYSEKAQELGGKIVKPETELPGFGWFAICVDTENNAFGLWEQNPQAMR